MIGSFLNILYIFIIFFFISCTQKTMQSTIQLHNSSISAITEGDYEINQAVQEISKRLSIPILDKRPVYDSDTVFDEVTMLKIDRTIHLILTGKIFQKNKAKPIENAIYIVEDIANIIKKYPHIVVQVTGHSTKMEEKPQELSDNRAITIAEILYKKEAKNDTFAKGCADKKPLFTEHTDDDSITNARIEIYLYPNKENMRDQCK